MSKRRTHVRAYLPAVAVLGLIALALAANATIAAAARVTTSTTAHVTALDSPEVATRPMASHPSVRLRPFDAAPPQCVLNTTDNNPGSDIGALEGTDPVYVAPAGATSVSGSTAVQGFVNWYTIMSNSTGASVSSPTITFNSGLNPSVFDGELPTSSFPSSCSLSSLPANESMDFNSSIAAPGIEQSFTTGFDSTLSVTPSVVPVGGGQVTVTVTVTLSRNGGILVNIPDINQNGVTLVSLKNPAIPNGETVSTCTNQPCASSPTTWDVPIAQAGWQYVFTAVVQVANPPKPDAGTAQPWPWSPATFISDSSLGSSTNETGQSVTIPVPSLDGSSPGSGSVVFSVGNGSQAWSVGTQPATIVAYPEAPYPPPCPNGASTTTLGKPTSATTSLDNATNVTDPSGGVKTRLTVPSNALPGNDASQVTTVSLYPIKNAKALEKALPHGHQYVTASAASWITSNGAVPAASKAATMSITDARIARGDFIYQVTAKGMKKIGTVKTKGSVKLTFTKDPTFVIATR